MTTKIWVGTSTPGDINVAANWSPSGVPEAGDDVYFENSSQNLTANLDALAALTMASLHVAQSFTGICPADTYLEVAATVVEIGYHNGPGTPNGSGRLLLDLKSVQSAITIHNSASVSTDSNQPPIRIKNTHASSTLEVRKGKVGFCTETGVTGQLSTVTLNYVKQKASDAEVYIGSGVTLATLTQHGGKLDLRCAATTLTVHDGSAVTSGSGAITTLNVNGGAVESNSTGTITAANVAGGLLDTTKSSAARTITTLKIDPPGKFKYDLAAVTLTNKIQPIQTSGVIAFQATDS